MKNIRQNESRIINGDCIEIMRSLPWASVDFILTDPPYLVNYRDRSDRSIENDANDGAWLKPADLTIPTLAENGTRCKSHLAAFCCYLNSASSPPEPQQKADLVHIHAQ